MDRKTSLLKIADLGLARAFIVPIKKYTREILTLWYRAPKVLLGWRSVGCMFAEFVTKQVLFPCDSELQQLLHIFWLLGTPNEDVWPGVCELLNWHECPRGSPRSLSPIWMNMDCICSLKRCNLQYDPSKRICAKKS